MPIKPENRKRYPANWDVIREQILARACHRCECCGAPQYAVGQWVDDRFLLAAGDGRAERLQYALVHSAARELSDDLNVTHAPTVRYIVIVLTIAHLDHTLENCDPINLRALCQRCHLRYDAQHHATNARTTRRAKKKNLELFLGEAV
jgi:hypothetical protein